jgi:hypothetical protein
MASAYMIDTLAAAKSPRESLMTEHEMDGALDAVKPRDL